MQALLLVSLSPYPHGQNLVKTSTKYFHQWGQRRYRNISKMKQCIHQKSKQVLTTILPRHLKEAGAFPIQSFLCSGVKDHWWKVLKVFLCFRFFFPWGRIRFFSLSKTLVNSKSYFYVKTASWAITKFYKNTGHTIYFKCYFNISLKDFWNKNVPSVYHVYSSRHTCWSISAVF